MASLTRKNMQDWIISVYPGDRWRKKVKAMPSEQIVALYYSLVRQGKIKN